MITSRRVCQRDTARTRPISQRDASRPSSTANSARAGPSASIVAITYAAPPNAAIAAAAHDERPHEHHSVLARDRMDVLIGAEEVFEICHCRRRDSRPPARFPSRERYTNRRLVPIAVIVLFSSPNPVDPDEPLTRFLEMLAAAPDEVTDLQRHHRLGRRSCSQASTAAS